MYYLKGIPKFWHYMFYVVAYQYFTTYIYIDCVDNQHYNVVKNIFY